MKTSLAPFKETVAEEENEELDENVDSSGSNEELDCAAIEQMEIETDLGLTEVKEKKEKLFEKSAGMNVS